MQILIVKENFKDMNKLNKLAKEAFLPEEYLPQITLSKWKILNYTLYTITIYLYA